MRNNWLLVFGSLLFSSIATFYFFISFGFCKNNLDFYLYDGIAIIIGVVFVGLSYQLLKVGPRHKYSHFLGIIIGFAMIITHGVKLFIGKCSI